MYNGKHSTLPNVLIDVAEEILNKCVISDPTKKVDDEDYSVLFSYEFLDDFRDPAERHRMSDGPIILKPAPGYGNSQLTCFNHYFSCQPPLRH